MIECSCTNGFRLMDLEDALRKISALGLKYVELSAEGGAHLEPKIRDGVSPQRTKDLLDEFNLEAAAISIVTNFAVSDAELDGMLDWVGKGIAYCRALGASVLRIFASNFHGRQVDRGLIDLTIRNIQRVTPVAEENGVQLVLENHDGLTASGEDVVRLIEGVGSPWLGANYDPANFVPAYGIFPMGVGATPWRVDTYDAADPVPVMFDPVEAGRQIGPYIKHCHLKDVTYLRSDRYNGYAACEMGAGVVDWRGVFQLLREIDYQGFLSIEYENTLDPVRGVRESVAYLRQLMAEDG